MPVREVVRDAPPRQHLPPDPNVVMPKHVLEMGSAADDLHRQLYGGGSTPQPEPQTPEGQQPEPQAQPQGQLPEPLPEPQAQHPGASQEPQPEAHAEELRVLQAELQQLRTQAGRLESANATIRQLQQQLSELSNELVRVQTFVQHQQQQPQVQPPRGQRLITEKDEENYGPELIDLTRRAAREVITPELEALRAENQQLRSATMRTQRSSIEQALDQHVPDWHAIYENPRFSFWLSLPDVYSGQVRSQLLKHAVAAGDAGRVVRFYQGFLAEEAATGHVQQRSTPGNGVQAPAQQPAQPGPPRQPVRTAASIAAPGAGRPAGSMQTVTNGAGPGADSKPTITRAEIDAFYADVRRNRYVGREQEKLRREHEIFAALGEGRVR